MAFKNLKKINRFVGNFRFLYRVALGKNTVVEI